MDEPAALERTDVVGVELEPPAECRRVRRHPMAVAVRVRVAGFNREREAHHHRCGGIEIVGQALVAKKRLHTRAQLGRIEGLGEEVVGACLDPLDSGGRVVEACNKHDRYQSRDQPALQLSAGGEPVHARHHHVEQHQVGWFAVNLAQRLLAGRRPFHHVAVARQEADDERDVFLVVVHDQNASG